MRFFLRSVIFLLLVVAATGATGYFLFNKISRIPSDRNSENSFYDGYEKELLKKLESKASLIRQFAKSEDYNSRYYFLIDMSIEPGKRRFFVYNNDTDSVEWAGLVTHGSGLYSGDMQFSNVPGSYCTSVGKYSIGRPYTGKFGLAYKLYGLDETNSNAFRRFVVLHAHSCVPDEEIYPQEICESQGCPTVSPDFLQKLSQYIDRSSKPILLWIYK